MQQFDNHIMRDLLFIVHIVRRFSTCYNLTKTKQLLQRGTNRGIRLAQCTRNRIIQLRIACIQILSSKCVFGLFMCHVQSTEHRSQRALCQNQISRTIKIPIRASQKFPCRPLCNQYIVANLLTFSFNALLDGERKPSLI